MTKLNLNKPTLPITPTQDADGNPTTCKACSRRAIGLGRSTSKTDAGYLCKQCIVAVGDLTKMDRLDQFELLALDGAVDAVGEWIEERGIGTELSHYDELDRRMMVKAAVLGFGAALRKGLRDAPF
jgi:hypothetical protein